MKALGKIVTTGFLAAILMGVAACTPTNTSGDTITPLNSPADELRTMLIGTWYGKQPLDGGGTYEFVTTRHSNANYEITFRLTGPQGQRHVQSEKGLWGARADHHYTIFKAFVEHGDEIHVNPMDTENYDIYKVLEFDGETMTYQHLSSGNVFKIKRVDDDFKLP